MKQNQLIQSILNTSTGIESSWEPTVGNQPWVPTMVLNMIIQNFKKLLQF